MKTRFYISTGFTALLIGLSVSATPSGLNNIPTADVVPERVLVLQTFGTVTNNMRPDIHAGFKYGLFDMLEIGIDGRVNQETSAAEAIAAQLNYRMEIDEYTAIGIGVANLGDRARNGWEDYYAVLTHDLDLLRLHAGGSLQRDNRGLFGGVDKTFSLWNRELVVRADVKQINDGHDVLSSIGFLYDVGNSLLLEVWGSHSDQPDLDDDDFLTIKLDYVIAF